MFYNGKMKRINILVTNASHYMVIIKILFIYIFI